MTPKLFAALYRGKSREKIASANGVPLSEELSGEKLALWERFKKEAEAGGSTPVGAARLAAKFAEKCVDQGEKISSDNDPIGRCVSIGVGVLMDDLINKMAHDGNITIKEAADLRVVNAECSLYELGLLTETR